MTRFYKDPKWPFNKFATDDAWTLFWNRALWAVPFWGGAGDTPTDLVGGAAGAQGDTPPEPYSWLDDVYGRAFRTQAADMDWPAVSAVGLQSITLGYYGRISGFAGQTVVGHEPLFYSNTVSPYNDLGFVFDNTGAQSGGVVTNNLQVHDDNAFHNTGFFWPPGELHMAVMEYDFVARTADVYIDGHLFVTLTGIVASLGATAVPGICYDANWGIGFSPTDTLGMAFLCNGKMGAVFQAQLAADPFGPFRHAAVIPQVDPFDWHDTVYSQYANSPTLLSVLASFEQNINPSNNIDQFYFLVWNIFTAQGWGLDVWGRIVGVGRVLTVNPKYLGFDEMGTLDADPFNQSPFYAGGALGGGFALSNSAYRTLILAKAAANITDCSVAAINAILRLLFPGVSYCTDGLNMTMTYTFGFTLDPVQAAIAQSGVIPKPTGVALTIQQGVGAPLYTENNAGIFTESGQLLEVE